MTILCIETSTSCCSAAITIDGVAVATKENLSGANHASELPIFVEQLLTEATTNGWAIEAVALSQGPGSYTGLRIGTSIAKGLCYGMNIPLIPLDTLQLLCAAVNENVTINALLCPMLDARRMEVYTAFYEPCSLCRKNDVQAVIIDENAEIVITVCDSSRTKYMSALLEQVRYNKIYGYVTLSCIKEDK